MNITCDIIRDLLPLYAEDLASDDSRKLVEEHISTCDACNQQLGILKRATPIPMENTPGSLKKIKNIIKRKRILSVAAAVLTLITVVCLVFTYLFTPFQLTMEQALDDFYIREDGAVVIDYSSYACGGGKIGDDRNRVICNYSTRYDMWKGDQRKSIQEVFGTDGVITDEERQRYENIEIYYGTYESADGSIRSDAPINGEIDGGKIVEWESEKNWWYFDPTGRGEDTLLHDAGAQPMEEGETITVATEYPKLVAGCLLGILALFLLRKVVKKPWMAELCDRFMILAGCIVVATLFVSGGRLFTSGVGNIYYYWNGMIGMNGVLLTLTTLFWRQLWLLNRQEKAA